MATEDIAKQFLATGVNHLTERFSLGVMAPDTETFRQTAESQDQELSSEELQTLVNAYEMMIHLAQIQLRCFKTIAVQRGQQLTLFHSRIF